MALVEKIRLKKYQVKDAYQTAPRDMKLFQLLARMANTCVDSLYGKARFDAVIFGDDPLVSLCLAAQLSSDGSTVLIAPDKLGLCMWPSPEWGVNQAAIHNHFDAASASEIAKRYPAFVPDSGFQKALALMIEQCSSNGRVRMLVGDFLQSSEDSIKGARSLLTFFPLQPAYLHDPKIHPLWKLASKRIAALAFNWSEIEFIQASKMFYTSPVSGFVDPKFGTPIGQGRDTKPYPLSDGGRADDVRSAFEFRGVM